MNFSKYINELKKTCQENGVKRLSVFGSAARGDFTPESDIDLLVRFEEPKGLIGLIALEDKICGDFWPAG